MAQEAYAAQLRSAVTALRAPDILRGQAADAAVAAAGRGNQDGGSQHSERTPEAYALALVVLL
ncbi:Hypothetical predicted protein [Lecanosticta acicola]|uniref:Uncharacterized protein n=1 Tax=Lecanosticta acicola TaxID=111012 RepID=A0AAI8Z599_9PEZI|nr:Hypothetical predicted protein [Lecanosticta acicola]